MSAPMAAPMSYSCPGCGRSIAHAKLRRRCRARPVPPPTEGEVWALLLLGLAGVLGLGGVAVMVASLLLATWGPL